MNYLCERERSYGYMHFYFLCIGKILESMNICVLKIWRWKDVQMTPKYQTQKNSWLLSKISSFWIKTSQKNVIWAQFLRHCWLDISFREADSRKESQYLIININIMIFAKILLAFVNENQKPRWKALCN